MDVPIFLSCIKAVPIHFIVKDFIRGLNIEIHRSSSLNYSRKTKWICFLVVKTLFICAYSS